MNNLEKTLSTAEQLIAPDETAAIQQLTLAVYQLIRAIRIVDEELSNHERAIYRLEQAH